MWDAMRLDRIWNKILWVVLVLSVVLGLFIAWWREWNGLWFAPVSLVGTCMGLNFLAAAIEDWVIGVSYWYTEAIYFKTPPYHQTPRPEKVYRYTWLDHPYEYWTIIAFKCVMSAVWLGLGLGICILGLTR